MFIFDKEENFDVGKPQEVAAQSIVYKRGFRCSFALSGIILNLFVVFIEMSYLNYKNITAFSKTFGSKVQFSSCFSVVAERSDCSMTLLRSDQRNS